MQRNSAPDTDRPAAGHPRLGRFRRARPDHLHAEHGTGRRQRHMSPKLIRYLIYTVAAAGLYLASLAYAHLENTSHTAIQATNTHR